MQVTRRSALKTAALLAVGFVGLRVVYRVIFGGAGGGGIVLIELPSIRLAGPFEHITLFGQVTTGGVLNAALSAVPFAVLVLVIGVVAAIVNIRALLTRGSVRGPVRTISRALVVAWATFPAMAQAVRRVRVGRQLRGERGSASLVVPVLEQTVERAIALGASMEVRGFAATGRAQPNCARPVSMVDVSLGYEDAVGNAVGNAAGDAAGDPAGKAAGGWLLRGIDLELAPGTLTVLGGATGSGKSTLLRAISGLFQHVDHGLQFGTIEVAGVDRINIPPRQTAGFIGVVAQSVRLSFVAATVREEIGFSLAIRDVAPVIVSSRVDEISAQLAIAHLLDRDVAALSAGEACLVAIAAAIVEHPVVLILDEPLAELDEAARVRVIRTLDDLAHSAGVAVVVAEHALDHWGVVSDVRLEIRDGAIVEVSGDVSDVLPAAVAYSAESTPRPIPTAGFEPTQLPAASIRNLSVHHGELEAVHDVSFELQAGEIVALRGPNGAGKSSLLHALARPGTPGAVVVGGRDASQLRRRTRRNAITLVPEAFDDLLFATTVAAECRLADRRANTTGTAQLLARLLGEPAHSLLQRHPRDLSAGQRLCLVIAIQLAVRPQVLLIDEPSRGLDAAARALVGGALVEAANAGSAVMIATHDHAFAERYAGRTITMQAGRLATELAAQP
jgi:energy-coupling factor transporter ATP-binding protein EcfA2